VVVGVLAAAKKAVEIEGFRIPAGEKPSDSAKFEDGTISEYDIKDSVPSMRALLQPQPPTAPAQRQGNLAFVVAIFGALRDVSLFQQGILIDHLFVAVRLSGKVPCRVFTALRPPPDVVLVVAITVKFPGKHVAIRKELIPAAVVEHQEHAIPRLL